MNSRTQNWGGRKQDVFVLLSPRRTWRESNSLLRSLCEAKGLQFYMSCDSFPDYRSANQAEGGQTPSADAESAVSRSHKPRPSTKDRRATSSVHPSVPHGHHCPCDPPVSQHDRSSRAAVGLRHPAAPPRQPACRHLPNGPQKRGS